MRTTSTLLATAILLFAAPAAAHLGLDDPPSRYGANVLKVGPCGMDGGERTANVTTYRSGQTITVRWNEYVNHPGHYRIAFDDDGHDDFADPPCLSECDNRGMEIELYSDDTVLLDGIEDMNGGDYSVDVTLPDIECDNCTLQVIQVMTDKPPYTIGGNDNYYQCADLVLTRDAAGDMGTPVLDMGGNNSSGDMGTTANNNAPPPQDMGANDPIPQPRDMGGTGADAGTGGKDEDGGCCATVRPSSDASGLLGLLFATAFLIRRRRRITLR